MLGYPGHPSSVMLGDDRWYEESDWIWHLPFSGQSVTRTQVDFLGLGQVSQGLSEFEGPLDGGDPAPAHQPL